MPLQILNSQASLDDNAISAFESEIGAKLPGAYRRFLSEYNGGTPSPKRFATLDAKVESMVAFFFPLSECTEDNLLDEFRGLTSARQIPSNLISIAVDPAENRILLSVSGDDAGKVYYWSWDEEPRNPTRSYKYMRLVSNSFGEFVSKLH